MGLVMASDPRFSHMQAAIERSVVGRQALQADPWQVVPAIEGALRDGKAPDELRNELQFARSVALARLGLKTAARESLEGCEHPARAGMEQLVAGLADDGVERAALEARARENLRALRGDTRKQLEGAWERWRTWLASVRAYRTPAGVVTLREEQGTWAVFINSPAAAAMVAQGDLRHGPFYLDGMHAPHLVRAVYEATAREKPDVQARLVLLAGCEEEALTGLALGELVDVLGAERTSVWVGEDGPARVHAEAMARLECTLGWVIATPGPAFAERRWARGEAGRRLGEAGAVQQRETDAARARVLAWERATRDERDDRLRQGGNLRVLLPTTRHSTFVGHMAADLAQTLEDCGHEARTVSEPDAGSVLTPLAFFRAMEQMRPDLVVFINTIREQMAGTIPEGMVTVTWVQDAMRHLFASRAGGAANEREFVMGHLHAEMLRTLGVHERRTLRTPVLASERKFHEGPVGEELRERLRCEVAYISHQSETPEALARRLAREGGDGTPFATMVRALTPVVIDMAQSADVRGEQLVPALREVTERTLRQHAGTEAAERGLMNLLHQVTHPIAERALRRQMVGWAADLCEQRGWRLHLYGRGWERDAALARHARGELGHGEELRAAYQCAAVQLHAGLGGAHHQRVLECALSGGCTLVRIKADDVRLLEHWAQQCIGARVRESELEEVVIRGERFWLTPIADHWEAMLVQAMYDELGVAPQHEHRGKQALATWQVEHEQRVVAMKGAWLAGDLAKACFWSRESLDEAVTRAVTSPARRACLAGWQREATREALSLRAQLETMLAMVSEELTRSLACRSA